MGSIAPETRRFASLNYVNGKLILVGGCRSDYEPTTHIYMGFMKDDDIAFEWVRMESKLARWGHASIIKNNSIWLCGGRSEEQDTMEVIKLTVGCNDIKIKKQPIENAIPPRRK